MEVIALENIQQKLKDLEIDIEKYRTEYGFLDCPITPRYQSLKVLGSPLKICDQDVRNRIRQRLIYNKYSNEIPESWYDDIAHFLLGENVPREEKMIVNEYLNDEIKDYILTVFLSDFAKNGDNVSYEKYVFAEDSLDEYEYRPRINGVPIHLSIKKKDGIVTYPISMSVSEIKKKILNKVRLQSIDECIIFRELFNSYSYFDEPWCPNYTRGVKANLNNDEWKRNLDDFFINDDELYIKKLISTDKVKHDVRASKKLRNKIINSIPQDFNQLEKSIYIYDMLSQILSYDPIFYIESMGHVEVGNIESYDEDNNKVVCYEFAYILADLLREIGIEHIMESNLMGEKFSKGHANIAYLVDDMVIFADSTTSVLEGDLSNAKFDDKYRGIRCELYNKEKQEKFKNAKDKVSQYMKTQDLLLDLDIPKVDGLTELTEMERIKIFVERLFNFDLNNLDLVAVANKLKSDLNISEYVKTNIYTTRDIDGKIYLKVEINPFGYVDNQAMQKFSDLREFKIDFMLDLDDKKVYASNRDIFLSESEYRNGKK